MSKRLCKAPSRAQATGAGSEFSSGAGAVSHRWSFGGWSGLSALGEAEALTLYGLRSLSDTQSERAEERTG